MIDMFEPKESDDEDRSQLTRDTEEQESRPISRASSPDSEDMGEQSSRAHRAKRRRIETGCGEDSDEKMDDSHARSLLAHCIHKDPENMVEKEIEQVLAKARDRTASLLSRKTQDLQLTLSGLPSSAV
jgi:histone-lysine N-methyltransferase SETD1